MTKFCKKCGVEYPNEIKFCIHCGSELIIKKEEMGKVWNFKRVAVFLTAALLLSFLWIIIQHSNLENINRLYQQAQSEISGLKGDVLTLQRNVKEKEETIETQQKTINQQQTAIEEQTKQIKQLQIKVTSLQTQVESLTYQLGQTTAQLEETTRLLNIAKNYEERVKQGIYLSEAYKLLGDYDKTVDIVKNITTIGTPVNDQEIWKRTKDIYNWLGKNYKYCSDKGFCVGDYCTQIQFFSPDELLYYGSKDVLCGDCDDQAQLFVGMLYASGVPHSRARVECGSVESGYHCWGGIYVNGRWYRIDPVCSNPAKYIEFFGIKILISGREFPTSYQNVDCFSNYILDSWYTPEAYHSIS